MLTRLRPAAARILVRLASPLAKLPADFYTVAGLAAAAPYLYAAAQGRPLAALLLLLASAALDALDGAVARLRGEAGPKGAYLDSLLDRVADVAYAAGLLLLGIQPLLVYAFATAALLVSYARAKYESLTGESMEGIGLMERGDRVIALAVVLALIAYMPRAAPLFLAAVTVLTWATFLHRLVQGYRRLPRTIPEG